MLAHLRKRHQVETGPLPNKRCRLSSMVTSEYYTIVSGQLEKAKNQANVNRDYGNPYCEDFTQPKGYRELQVDCQPAGDVPFSGV